LATASEEDAFFFNVAVSSAPVSVNPPTSNAEDNNEISV
jgi:hypothetical protein